MHTLVCKVARRQLRGGSRGEPAAPAAPCDTLRRYAQADTATLCPFYLPNALTPLLTLSTPRPLLPELAR